MEKTTATATGDAFILLVIGPTLIIGAIVAAAMGIALLNGLSTMDSQDLKSGGTPSPTAASIAKTTTTSPTTTSTTSPTTSTTTSPTSTTTTTPDTTATTAPTATTREDAGAVATSNSFSGTVDVVNPCNRERITGRVTTTLYYVRRPSGSDPLVTIAVRMVGDDLTGSSGNSYSVTLEAEKGFDDLQSTLMFDADAFEWVGHDGAPSFSVVRSSQRVTLTNGIPTEHRFSFTSSECSG